MQVKRKAKRNIQMPKPAKNKQGFGYEMPPDKTLVQIYFDQKGLAELTGSFYKHYDDDYWQSPNGTPYRNWKVLATDWIFNHQQDAKLRQRQIENRTGGL
jgi:hypothetical protein